MYDIVRVCTYLVGEYTLADIAHAGNFHRLRELTERGGGLSWNVPQRGDLDGAARESRELQSLHIGAVSALGVHLILLGPILSAISAASRQGGCR